MLYCVYDSCAFKHAFAEAVKEIRGVIGGLIWGDIPR